MISIRFYVAAAVVALFITGPVAAQKVFVDYDRDSDLDSYRTFQFHETGEDLSDTDPLVHQQVIALIEKRLFRGTLRATDSDPDLYVTYHTAEKENVRFHTTGWDYGYPGAWYWGDYWGGGWGSHTTTATTFVEGTLIVDLWEARTKKLVWRGIATATVASKSKKNLKKIESALHKMSKRFQKMRRKESR